MNAQRAAFPERVNARHHKGASALTARARAYGARTHA